jgi:phosphate transport system protein
MVIHLQREMERLKNRVLHLSAVVEESTHKAVKSLEERNRRLAQQVIENDIEIDKMEVEIEEECLKILALHQPVAVDLRFIIAVLKINNGLERIGDIAVNIAERATFLATRKRLDIPFDFYKMAEKAQSMLKRSLDALMKMDPNMARDVCASDDEVDAMNREMYLQVEDGIRKHPDRVKSLMHLLSASRHLERMADLATNIAEDVIYLTEGEIVRHRAEDYDRPSGKAGER